MIVGTIMGVWGAFRFGPGQRVWGPSGRAAAPGLRALSLVHAVATITFGVDQIVSGVVINIVAIGLARFLSQLFFGQATQSDPGGPAPCRRSISRCSRSSPRGSAGRFRTCPRSSSSRSRRRSGAVRAEQDALRASPPLRWREPRGGANARRVRLAISVRGRLDLRGPGRAVGRVPLDRGERRLHRGAEQGLGFIALAALILATGSPCGCLWPRCSLASHKRFRCGSPTRRSSRCFPAFIRMLPYVVTIVAIAGFVGRVEAPEAAGKAYSGKGAREALSLGPEEPVAEVTEARHDVAVLVEPLVERRGEDTDVGVLGLHARDALGGGDDADEADVRRPAAP